MCVHRCLQTTIDYCGIAHPGHNSKLGLPIEAYFTSGTLIFLFIQKLCQIIARRIEINITVFHLLNEYSIYLLIDLTSGGSTDTCLSLNRLVPCPTDEGTNLQLERLGGLLHNIIE